ncbi:unnamed protein product [Spirodela intermedia]|uniref:Uncharacterized protein n=1 Tax=Spirodela intermedia TaxID=51605 RepID=A0A7I8L1D0_SPIIN|nr:unnamed protein product [Spirodela intermedia]
MVPTAKAKIFWCDDHVGGEKRSHYRTPARSSRREGDDDDDDDYDCAPAA